MTAIVGCVENKAIYTTVCPWLHKHATDSITRPDHAKLARKCHVLIDLLQKLSSQM